jgi:hypothetical protein
VIRSENYKDIHSGDKVGTMGKVSKGELPFLFYKNIDGVDIESKDDEIQSMSFYTFFSKDNWGKHFISKAQLSLPIEDIAMETGVNIHAITDIDGNNRYEVWVSYELMYGEIGVMVYQKDESEEWKLVVNHCFMCD